MDYTISDFTWSIYTQKLTTSTLALKRSVSAIIYPRWTATQRLFWIENQTITSIKETEPILAIYDSIWFLHTKGAPLLGEAPLIGRLQYILSVCPSVYDWTKIKFTGPKFTQDHN